MGIWPSGEEGRVLIRAPGLHFVTPGPGFSSRQSRHQEAGGDALSSWATATHVGDVDGVTSYWLWPGHHGYLGTKTANILSLSLFLLLHLKQTFH